MKYSSKLIMVSTYQPKVIEQINHDHSCNIGYSDWEKSMLAYRGGAVMMLYRGQKPAVRLIVGAVVAMTLKGENNHEAWAQVITPSRFDIKSGAAVVTVCAQHGLHVGDIIVSEKTNIGLQAQFEVYASQLTPVEETGEVTEDLPVEELKVDPLRKLDPTLN